MDAKSGMFVKTLKLMAAYISGFTVLTPSLPHIQLSYMFVNSNIHLLHVSLDISNTLVDMYMKLRKHLGFDMI